MKKITIIFGILILVGCTNVLKEGDQNSIVPSSAKKESIEIPLIDAYADIPTRIEEDSPYLPDDDKNVIVREVISPSEIKIAWFVIMPDGETIMRERNIKLVGIADNDECFEESQSALFLALSAEQFNAVLESDPLLGDLSYRYLKLVSMDWEITKINELLIETGWAVPSTNYSYSEQEKFLELYEAARSKGIGIWDTENCAGSLNINVKKFQDYLEEKKVEDAFISIEPRDLVESSNNAYYIYGNTSDNCHKIIITATNESALTYDEYELQDYKLGDTSFYYGLREDWNNLYQGRNEYTFTAYCEGNKVVSTDYWADYEYTYTYQNAPLNNNSYYNYSSTNFPSYNYKKTFKGYECTQDCSGHEAGYEWAEDKDIYDIDDCSGNSQSFIEGCWSYVEEEYDDKSLKYNYMDNSWDYAYENESLRYDYMDDEYQFAPDNYSLKYDYLDNEYEFASDKDSLKYNYMEDEYNYVPDDYSLKYNYMENTWEYADDNAGLEYNYMDDSWSYE